jgi:hypothetical protein
MIGPAEVQMQFALAAESLIPVALMPEPQRAEPHEPTAAGRRRSVPVLEKSRAPPRPRPGSAARGH